ncbi:MAG TPA: penicillin-binding protein [Bacteroidota bacterium]|nr:penicillin-binding protein [Bacteroidota bacterium]
MNIRGPAGVTPQKLNQMPLLPRREVHPDEAALNRRWRRRLHVLQLGLLIFFCAICVRLVQIQIVESERFTRLGDRQYEWKEPLPATRGSIFDRNGHPIASHSMFVSIAANPRIASGGAAKIAAALSKITGQPARSYLAGLKSKQGFVWLARQVRPEAVQSYSLDTLKGLIIADEPKRVYHTGNVAGQYVGTTNVDNKGIAGVELEFDGLLAGVPGYVVYQKDATANLMPSVDYPRVDPVRGHSLVLTLDMWLQQVAESELEKGVRESDADGGIVVMLDPHTGEVLVMAQSPRINPADFGKVPKADQKLRAVTDMFEPGSVFKLVTASAALEYGLISPERTFFAENGIYNVPVPGRKNPRVIRDVHKYGMLTFKEAMEFSSNIVMAKASNIIGDEKLYRMARDYGFGTKTNIDYPGEIGGRLTKPVAWSALTRQSVSYGYEVGATPIQIAAAYAAVANSGVLMRPYILKRQLDADSNVIAETSPQPVRRVVSEETARIITSFLEGVVERGTAVSAKVEGVRIAGKTGTSKRLVNGKYEGGEYTASFVGYFPAERPRIVCLVMLDNPRGINYHGGTTSAPIFRGIVKRIVTGSDLYGMPIAELGSRDPQFPAMGAGQAAATESPAGRDLARRKNLKMAASRNVPERKADHVVPDVRGYSIRKAVGILRDEKFSPVVHGSGMVVSQRPGPGEPVRSGMVITLECQPKTSDLDGTR